MLFNLKKFASQIFLKFLSQDIIARHIQQIVTQGALKLPPLSNLPSPYDNANSNKADLSLRKDIVFISSRFRSGSTLLWNLFRQSGVCTSYYEPFNERQWFDPKLRGVNVDNSHRGVDDYWAEYADLTHLSNLYNEDWIRNNLLMTEKSWQPGMKSYIEELITAAPLRPVLQFNRIDFRLTWLKHHFPQAKILHLYRNPRDQWCSFLGDPKVMNKDDVQFTYQDSFYLDIWCQDLTKHYPVLDKNNSPHPYQRFYYLWKLSLLHGQKFSDLSVNFEELTQNPQYHIKAIFELLQVDNIDIQALSSVIQAPEPERWKKYANDDWFRQHEEICERNLSLMLNVTPNIREL